MTMSDRPPWAPSAWQDYTVPMNTYPSSVEPLDPVLSEMKAVVLGAGRVGSAVGILLQRAGVEVVAVTARSATHAQAAASRLGAQALTDNAEAARLGDIIFVTTSDAAIEGVVSEIARAGALRKEALVIHMSGALPLSVLDPATSAGALVGCTHPLVSCADVDEALRAIPGSYFGVTAGSGAEAVLDALVRALGGRRVDVFDEAKALYHAAAVVASNYLVALEDVAVTLLERAGFDREQAAKALQPLLASTVSNIGALGTTAALTGPIARGDAETVLKHRSALDAAFGQDPEGYADLYRTLGMHALRIAERRGTLDPRACARIRSALGLEESAT